MSLSSITGVGLYNYATLSNTASYAGSYSSSHSRDPSYSRRPSVPMNSYPASLNSRARNSTDSRVDPYSYPRTSESSHATKATSVNEEAMRILRRKQNDRKNSVELSYSSSEQPRYHRHSHHAYHSHHPDKRDDRYNSASAKSRRRMRRVVTPPDPTLSPPPEPSAAVETKPRRKSKWRFWTKQEPDYIAEVIAAPPSPPKPRDELGTKVITKRRPSITEWLAEDSSPPQSPTTLKRLFEEEE
ncbi:hypothetical protein FAUST_9484 [Fusarium austroamericanum]|uniref:Uncharacterized protein n=1 Tax=Fusarium austroamericanum TaxID=282268 RepID=A0AAN5Z4S8_FUSAU|nr:hypothetical protein FAUST_9484 [Fusarium austroamericanum]